MIPLWTNPKARRRQLWGPSRALSPVKAPKTYNTSKDGLNRALKPSKMMSNP